MSKTSPVTLVRPPSIEEVIKRRRPLRNVNKEVARKISPLDKLALWLTVHVGSMGFFLIILVWTAIWLGWNLLAPATLQFDPPMAFVFWLFISNVIQILLMPLIMVGQNVQGTHAELRAEHDLEVNVKAEREIEVILRHLEYQNSILLATLEKLGVSVAGCAPRPSLTVGRLKYASRGFLNWFWIAIASVERHDRRGDDEMIPVVPPDDAGACSCSAAKYRRRAVAMTTIESKPIRRTDTHPYVAEIIIDPAMWHRFQQMFEDQPEVKIRKVNHQTPDAWKVYVACASEAVKELLETNW